MCALTPLLLITLVTVAPVGAFLVIALVSLRGAEPAERTQILRELAAMIPWRSGQPTDGRQSLPNRRRIKR